jgi:hypothetical protein
MEQTILKELIALFDLPKITLAISLLALYAYKNLKEHLVKKRARRTETLQQIIDFYKEYEGPRKEFLMEQLCYNHFGVLLSHREIDFFLSSGKPSIFLHQYLSARQFIELSEGSDQLVVKPGKSLAREKIKGLAWYFVCGMCGVTLLVNAHSAFAAQGPQAYGSWTVVILSLFVLAWIGMDSATGAMSGEKLTKSLGNAHNNRFQATQESGETASPGA